MTRRQEFLVVILILLAFAFMSLRATERRIWMNQIRYDEGLDRANMVYIHKQMGGIFK